ncbi:fungal fucose-specific lectin [Diaporthe amygdali]|uniref:fungal fucose-specific lectin n=1 Tax=Phomopsis amygdali TaxID=1214568 RepID=UPI0022FDED07|nr:fungal fucose-specific lectin [Diaporthe amygdali]KAJ0118681.1 fungal fucose-specific lectin [Diaporthe amygdali]
MDTRERKKSYSDLEAIIIPNETAAVPSPSSTTFAPSGRKSYWNEKFAISDGSSANNNANPFSDDKAAGLSPVDSPQVGPPAYYLVDSKGQAQALYAAPTNDVKDPLPTPGSLGGIGGAGIFGGGSGVGERKTLFGLRRSTFIALSAGIAFLIIGLLVTVLAVTAPWTKHTAVSSDSPPVSSESAGITMPDSRLAAMNWTDATGTTYTGVFYQSSNTTGSALMAAVRASTADVWMSINMSASANAAGLDVLDGTPIAAASNNGLWNVYYLTPARQVAELYSTNPTSSSGWLQGEMGSSLGNPEVAPGSGLAAMWQSCDNCTDSLLVLYQDAGTGHVQMANMTKLVWAMGDVVSTSAAPGTGLGVSAFTDFNGNGSTGTDLNAVRMYYADGGDLIEKLKGPLTDFRLETGNFGNQITSDLAVNPSPEIASLTFGNNGWTNNIVLTLDQTTGALQSSVYRGSDWAVQTPSLDGSPENVTDDGFSAIAATQTMKMFAIGKADGLIHEYQTNTTNPFQWNWQGVVDVPGLVRP